jgi:hypothetical protein
MILPLIFRSQRTEEAEAVIEATQVMLFCLAKPRRKSGRVHQEKHRRMLTRILKTLENVGVPKHSELEPDHRLAERNGNA